MSRKFGGSRRQSTSGSFGDSFSYSSRRRRSKTDWAGVAPGDAFKGNLDYYVRLPAQRMFYAACRKTQANAARLAGVAVQEGFQPEVKPQLGPCYTSYPASLASYAAIGLTGFLEFQSRTGSQALSLHLADYLKNPAMCDGVDADPDLYLKLAQIVTRSVQNRLLLEDLARSSSMFVVELYRLFLASQQSMRFTSVTEVVDAVVLYGDILPDFSQQTLHPVTQSILQDLDRVCARYAVQLANSAPAGALKIGVVWVQAICIALSKYLAPAGDAASVLSSGDSNTDKRNAGGTDTDVLAPLNAPRPPAFFEPPSAGELMALLLAGGTLAEGERDGDEEKTDELTAAQAAVNAFASALQMAGGQNTNWQDMRSDLLERNLVRNRFAEGPIQGNPTDGHEVKVKFGAGEVDGGEIFDRPVTLSEDLPALQKLLEESRPIATVLRRSLYPNVEQVNETQHLRTTGSLDPARLVLADFSAVVFKRQLVRQKADRRGRPVLLIACDGSGSLNAEQMKMLKVLTAAWLTSTVKSDVQVLAGLYHSGVIRAGVTGPLVQWMFHPRKTPATGRVDAVRAVVSLPDDGTGVQSDALSLAFMLEEARQLARQRMIYLILISDCEWNRSFNTQKTGMEEVWGFFETTYEQSVNKLHTTLVALGVDGPTGFEDLLDKVILVSKERLADYATIAEEIGLYVASCMKERRKFTLSR